MEAPVELLLVTYAKTKINEAFEELMVHLFGDMDVKGSGGRFKQPSVKKKKRIMSKVKGDLKVKDHTCGKGSIPRRKMQRSDITRRKKRKDRHDGMLTPTHRRRERERGTRRR